MFKKIRRIDLLSIFIIFAVITIDRVTKIYIDHNFKFGQSKIVVNNFFNITYTRNTGAGFSILEGQMLFFYIVTAVTIVILSILYFKENDKMLKIGAVLIFAGALGNFYDRIRFNYVIDFLHFIFGTYHFPIFNVADMSITIGGFILLICYFLKGNKT